MIKKLPVLFLAAMVGSVNADECKDLTSIEHDTVTVKRDLGLGFGMYQVRAPQRFNGMELQALIMSMAKTGSGQGMELSLSLAVSADGDFVNGYFHMPTEWLDIRVAATYGEGLCTELVTTFNM
ncbi:MAG: hypothetical protein LAT63_10895 [Marinobacter sp.]|nr:hypothetical protein [Marinobacter sp.]